MKCVDCKNPHEPGSICTESGAMVAAVAEPASSFQEIMASAIRATRLAALDEAAQSADEHSKNCGACGCDGWQIAETIRSLKSGAP